MAGLSERRGAISFLGDTPPYRSGRHRHETRIISPWPKRIAFDNLVRTRRIGLQLYGRRKEQAKAIFVCA
ncbi:hypothetical protein MPNT_50125 [Candidatus Methylacidithermus pantelleriae]|uniref:Uncharacterized protein n=1 Tax=Candidatus Methylacidithermus pantelleriae TaxID=2744239 RepID=A0A8J2FTK2_9BACT|nr:hypothetical protein MPNT_50125 [Candidatus Methylacidithermus pantelleriae]